MFVSMNRGSKYFVIQYLCNLLLIIATLLVLAIVFVPSIDLLPGEMAGQWNWFSKTGIMFSLLVICTVWVGIRRKSFFPDIVVWELIIIGGIEAIDGLGQLYGFNSSNHALYSMTGTFLNPGPYSGYLAMVFPLCLNEWLHLKVKRLKTIFDQLKYYLALMVILLIMCTLPAGMSRSAWLAVLISTIYVCGVYYSWRTKLLMKYHQRKGRTIATLIILFLILLLGGMATFQMKKNSAYGRVFMWKISCLAIAEKPLSGYGTNNFPLAYGKAQEAYFYKGKYSQQEELVAGSPEYAFNEYLQVAVEWGVPVLICVMIFVGFCLWRGHKLGNIGVCGAIISLLIFSGTSYPMQLPAFIITMAFLLAVCLMGQSKWGLVIFALVVGGSSLYWSKREASKECKQWVGCHILYRSGAYQQAVQRYEQLYPKLNDRAIFMYEYGHTLHKLKQYDASIERLQEAAKLSCDPMILNIIGLNYQEKSEYSKAEEMFKRSINMLPGRIYPYYLLAKLYALPSFYHEKEMHTMIEIVLNKKPKIPSKKIDDMRREMQILITKVTNSNEETKSAYSN